MQEKEQGVALTWLARFLFPTMPRLPLELVHWVIMCLAKDRTVLSQCSLSFIHHGGPRHRGLSSTSIAFVLVPDDKWQLSRQGLGQVCVSTFAQCV
jgi:hypothetical protein